MSLLLMYYNPASSLGQVKAGRMKALAVTTARRSALAPDNRPEEFAARIRAERAKYAPVIKTSGAKAD